MNWESFWLGACVATALIIVLWINDKQMHTSILKRVGDAGGSEKIGGVWYRIRREEIDHD